MILRWVRSFSSASLSLSSAPVLATAAALKPLADKAPFHSVKELHRHRYRHHLPGSIPFPFVDTRIGTALFSSLATSDDSNDSSSSSSSKKAMPQPPYRYQSASGSPPVVLDLSDLSTTIAAADEQRQVAYEKSRAFQKALAAAQTDLEKNGGSAGDSLSDLEALLADAVGTGDAERHHRAPRIANLAQRAEDLCRFAAFRHFLRTGKLLPPSACGCEGTSSAQSVGRERPTRNTWSVSQARDLVEQILSYLMGFDFRNGVLRRRYDGTKYALKSLETLLYELSVTGASLDDEEEPEAKKARLEDNDDGTPETAVTSALSEELDALRLRYEHRDGLREQLIKKSRDGQKAAKQAIYALHRKDYKKAAKLIQDCEKCILEDLLPIVTEEPPLRASSYAGVVEEYVEAKLFYSWLLGADGENTEPETIDGTLLSPGSFPIALEPGDYLGGICDLTGEIGRFAVQRGTARDKDGVFRCLEANRAVLAAIRSLEKPPGNISKKMGQLQQSVTKIERMVYELSLSEAAGMKRNSGVEEAPADEGG
ncbi:unnamed protein product [Pseudo-nitzschia multistriata]|uniref:Translin n=1 Tax=Pseudo-nitzschia multistriata TaxID=183589 RepID=A0A448YVF9_9STRA|nr:unnamed protein product [Pseudo-nitzschia multistriata]